MQYTRCPKTGRFTGSLKVKNGSLYDFRGVTVRARKVKTPNGQRLVSVHNVLFGFVPESQLAKINTRKVKTYLKS